MMLACVIKKFNYQKSWWTTHSHWLSMILQQFLPNITKFETQQIASLFVCWTILLLVNFHSYALNSRNFYLLRHLYVCQLLCICAYFIRQLRNLNSLSLTVARVQTMDSNMLETPAPEEIFRTEEWCKLLFHICLRIFYFSVTK